MQSMKIDYSRILGSASTSKALANDIYKDLQANGWTIVWQSDSADLWKSKEVIFQTTLANNPLNASQPWRIAFIVSGHNDNTLTAYVGTAETMSVPGGGAGGINTQYSYKAVLIQGGSASGDSRISPSRLYSYQITLTDRGLAVVVWEQLQIEDMRFMGLLCVQRPVSCGGTTFTEGTAPVFAVSNTNPSGKLDDRFFFSVIRESDVGAPTLTNAVASTAYKATGSIRCLGGGNPSVVDIYVNGFRVRWGWGEEFPRHSNDLSLLGWAGAAADATNLYNILRTSNDARVQQATYTLVGDTIEITAKETGTAGNAFSLQSSNTGHFAITGPTLMGGGAGIAATGTIKFTAQPVAGDTITFNGTSYTFVTNPPLNHEIEIKGTLTDTVQAVLARVQGTTVANVVAASYAITGNDLVITHNTPGISGNAYFVSITGSFATMPTGGKLAGGAGFDVSGNLPATNEISDRELRYGNMIHHMPNEWEGPVTNDDGEYILVFPFGFCTSRTAYTEEMDMIAVSKGPAYQGIQAVDINVYGEQRQYVSISSNFKTRDDYVRIFVLSNGGGI